MPTETGSHNATVMRWIVGASFIIIGVGSSITAIAQKRRQVVVHTALETQNQKIGGEI
jgi:hypothetical protein